MNKNYTYLLRCADGSLYCGWTNRLEQRIEAHNAGRGAKYTKSKRPVSLAYYEVYGTKEEAMKREAALKKLSKKEKEELAAKWAAAEKEETEKETAEETAADFHIIISPAKKMKVNSDVFSWKAEPLYIEQAEELMQILKSHSEAELKQLFAANDAITHENFLRYRSMDLRTNLSPAALSYVGIQYQYMSPQVFSAAEWDYVCRHLRILSGFYGILRADDGIVPYRLEMQAKLATEKGRDLYSYWGARLHRTLAGKHILNLASKEYSRAVEPWLTKPERFVTCVFGTLSDGKVKVKATEAKMARGEMVRFLAQNQAEELDAAKQFDRLGFSFDPERSNDTQFVFIKS